MNHRTMRGKLLYLHDTHGETGREWFTVTVQPSGERTVRAHCEMEDEQVLRDVVWSMDPDWRPIDAYVRLSVGGVWQGSGWFYCTTEPSSPVKYRAPHWDAFSSGWSSRRRPPFSVRTPYRGTP